MSRRRKGRKGRKRSVAHLRKYWFKKKGRKRPMAKRRKSRKTRRRSGGRRVHHRRRRHGGGGGGGGGRGLAAVKSDGRDLVVGALYGLAEAKAKADANFPLNKIPRPIVALGYTGNIAAMLYLATMVTPNRYVRIGARVVATIAAYKMGKNGGAYTSSDTTTIGGSYDGDLMSGDERVIDANMMGALDAEATERVQTRQGLAYDDVVREAGSRV